VLKHLGIESVAYYEVRYTGDGTAMMTRMIWNGEADSVQTKPTNNSAMHQFRLKQLPRVNQKSL
jgi:hypothetical protein